MADIFDTIETDIFDTIDGGVAIDDAPAEGFPPDVFTQLTNTERAIDLLPEDSQELGRQIQEMQANPLDSDARARSSLYFSEKLGLSLEDSDLLLESIAKQQWGIDDMSPEQIFSKIQESENALLRNKVGESFDLAPFSTFGNAFAQSLAGKPAAVLEGAQVFTKEGKAGDIVDVGLQRASEFFLSLQDAEKKKEIDAKLQGRLWPVDAGDRWWQISAQAIPEAINTWAATIGDQIPLMLMTFAGREAGKLISKPLAGVVAPTVALTTAGPDPTDVITVPLAAKAIEFIGTNLGGAAPMVAIEAAGFMDHANSLGIDKDVAEKWARRYGSLSGMIEYSQIVFRMKAFRVLSKKQQLLVMGKVFKVLGATSLVEGLEEFSQNALQNKFINNAIADQKERNPAFAAKKLNILEGGGRSFATGVGVSLFTTGIGSATVRGAQTVSEAVQAKIDKTSEDFASKPIIAEPVAEAEPTAAREAELESEAPAVAEPPTQPTDIIAPKAAEAKPEAVEGEVDQAQVGAVVIKPKTKVAPVSEQIEGEIKKVSAKAEQVKPVLPTKIVSPGQAGPFKVTFRATEGVPATRVIVDPQVRRSIQSGENKIAVLKTKLKQAQADKKQAVIAATQNQITKAEAQIVKLKERQQIKLTTTIEKAKTKVLKLQQSVKFKDSLRRDAISMIQAIPKDLQPGFIKRASNVTTLKGVQRLANEIEAGLDRAEKQESIKTLKTAAKAINPKKMLPEFAGIAQAIKDSLQLGKPQAEVIAKTSEIKAMAQQVLENSREDSVATIQAQRVLDEVNQKTSKTFAINQLSIEAIDQITDTLIALRFQNEADTIAAKDENATEAIRRRKLITESIVEIPDVPESLGGKGVRKFKGLHDNLESVLDAVAGARPGTYDLWVDSKNPTTRFIYDVLDAGVDQQILHSEKARDILRDILDNNNVASSDILNWSMRPEDVSKVKKAFGIAPNPKVHKFTLKNAKNVSTPYNFTTNELMSIFMHSRNTHNLDVLLNDGLNRIIDGKKQKIRGFTVDIVDDMVASLTDQQKNVARQVSTRLMDGLNKDAGNKTSVKLEFFEILRVNNYWPANRSIIRGPKGKLPTGLTKTIESLAFLKERVGTGNPLKFAGFFETVHNVNKNMSSYVGLAEPLREVKAVYTPEVIESLEDDGRGDQAKAITKLIERFEDPNVRIEGAVDKVVARMLGGFAKSKLFLNVKLAPRQQFSSFLISAYVNPKFITEFKGVGTAELRAEIKALSPQFGARADGLQFDRDTGDAFVENELMNYLTGDTSAIDKTAIGLKFFDTNAIVDIYRAVKAEVADAGVNINTPEGKAILKDRFEWVARHTQPMWHPKDRSLLGSDPRPLVRSLTMFMSQREQMVRMVNNSIADFANSKKTVEDQARLGRSLGAVAMNMVLFSIYNAAWAVLIQRRKKDVLDLMRDVFSDALSLPFFGGYFAKLFELAFNTFADKPTFHQFDFDDGPVVGILQEILLEGIGGFARAGKHLVTGEKYPRGNPNAGEFKWKNELVVATDALVDGFASLKGIPYHGAKDIVKSVKAQFTEPEKKRTRR